MSKNQKTLVVFLILVVLAVLLVSYLRHRARNEVNPPTPTPVVRLTGDPNIALGEPSGATSDAGNKNDYLLVKPQYVLSYNNDKGEPNWVSWHLQAADIGDVERQNNFHAETALPAGFKRVTPDDYTSSGFDRGHVCNSKDRTASEANNSETFSMANMLPQTPDLNRHVWEQLESYCRTLAQQGNELYIIAGGYGAAKTIGRTNKLNVPTNCWKIVLVVPQGQSIDKNARVIAVDMPNTAGIANDPWAKYTTTVSAIEQQTGYHFFPNLPADLQTALKTKKDAGR